ncbi:MAG TPA: hypothetical protein VEI25_06905, partial [Paraburkholderia sp.]|nr:hypothetical protein [Paraburkholderia sp.]
MAEFVTVHDRAAIRPRSSASGSYRGRRTSTARSFAQSIGCSIIDATTDRNLQDCGSIVDQVNEIRKCRCRVLNWVVVAGAVEHLDLNWFEYV